MQLLLNDEQQSVINSRGHIMIVATAGSGKTRTLIAKASHILKSSPANRLACITFTRNAANEFQERVAKSDIQATARRLGSGTFHSLALKLIKSEKPKIKVISEFQSRSFLHKAWSISHSNLPFDHIYQEVKSQYCSLNRDFVVNSKYST